MQPDLVRGWLKGRLAKPGLLSLAGALTTLGIAGGFLVSSPLFYQSGPWAGAWWNLGNGIFLGFWGIIVTIFAWRLLVGERRHILWGSVVVTCNALTGIFIMGIYSRQLVAASYIPSVFTLSDGLTLIGMMTSPALGVVGGLLGVFWKRSWKQGAAIPGLAGASRRALIGGVMMFFMVLPVSLWNLGPFSPFAAFLVIVFGWLVYKGQGDRRALGLLIIAGSMLAGYPFYGGDVGVASGTVSTFPVYVKSPFYLYTRVDRVWTTWAFIGLAGLVLAIISGLQTIFWKETTE